MSPDARPAAGGVVPRRRFRYGPLVADVTADAASLAWLEEFLAPAFDVGPCDGAPAPSEVAAEASPRAHAALAAALAAAPPATVEAWTLDGSFERLASWRDPDGWTWAEDPGYASFVGVDAAGRRVRVVAGEGDGRHRLPLMRAVRELATEASLRAGRVPLHASAFRLGSRTVLAAGPKRSGKTSLLVHALRRGAALVSNDRVFVDVDGEAVVARGMPTIVMLRDGTLRLFPGLEKGFEDARFDRGRTLVECLPGVERADPVHGAGFDRPGITTAQLASLLGARLEAGGPVDALLFPRLDADARGLLLEPLDDAGARAAAAKGLLVPSHPTRTSPLFAAGGRPLVVEADAEAARLARLVARVPVFACRLGPDAYDLDLEAVLEDALASGGPRPRAPRRRT